MRADINITEPNEQGVIKIVVNANQTKIVSVDLNGRELGVVRDEVSTYEWQIREGRNVLSFQITDTNGQKKVKEFRVDYSSKPRVIAATKPNMIALVIGNSSYASQPLANAVNDARSVAEKLQGMGYKTITALNQSKDELLNTITSFGNYSMAHDVALVYYAGHGIQSDNVNYIVPTDFDTKRENSTAVSNMINIGEVVDKKIHSATKIIILDACRDNPYVENYFKGRGLKFQAGLAPMEATIAPLKAEKLTSGTLISFSTKNGSVASDGTEGNSPFTKSLLTRITDPVDINIVFRRIREDVMLSTKNQQIPWEYGSLIGKEIVIGAN